MFLVINDSWWTSFEGFEVKSLLDVIYTFNLMKVNFWASSAVMDIFVNFKRLLNIV